ncbi:MAG TPA: DUF2442 domain-containing protein [Pyrinomonadaceae bacterium]|jgi:hypothetical protein|nr:DUF2442 domain-containing protein [Pyrinomonadaceae bacterium]
MKELVLITAARYVSGYTLEVSFSDGIKAEIDFSGWIEKFPFFAPLKDIEYFKNFSLDGWTVGWENGADIAPETLHEIALQKQQVKVA